MNERSAVCRHVVDDFKVLPGMLLISHSFLFSGLKRRLIRNCNIFLISSSVGVKLVLHADHLLFLFLFYTLVQSTINHFDKFLTEN